jgi:hypothetical protein
VGAVAVFDAAAFTAEEFVSGEAGGVLVREAHPVHRASHVQAGSAVRPFDRLRFGECGRAGEGSAPRVEAHAAFADPDHTGAAVTQHAHGLVGDAGAGTEQQRPDGRRGNVGDAVGVFGGNRVVLAVQCAAFEVDEGDPVSHAGEFSRGGRTALADGGHGQAAARVISPQP